MNQELYCEQEALEKLSRLPVAPIASQIIEITKSEDAAGRDFAEIVENDAKLATRLLNVVNFTSGLPRRLSTVSEAIGVLGLSVVKSVALGLTVFPFDSANGPRDGFNSENDFPITLRQMWEHALGSAVLAARLGALIDYDSRHQAFAAGFLHDIGRVLVFRYWRESLFEALTVAQDKNIPQLEAETLAFGRDHLEIGELWSRTSNLDPLFSYAIRFHHRNISLLGDFEDQERRLIAIVQLADSLCEAHSIGKGGDQGINSDGLWAMLNLTPDDHRQEVETIRQEILTSGAAFGFIFKEVKPLRRVRVMRKHTKRIETAGPKGGVGSGKGRVIPFPSRKNVGSGATERTRDQKLTILVVEDHGSLCDMLSLYFMRYGYHVRTANDGQSALDILASEEIDLVLLDLMLPRVDGFTVLRQMREKRDQKPPYVIVVSAGASAKDRNRVLELGANEYMPKPFHLMRLLERIQNVEKYLLG